MSDIKWTDEELKRFDQLSWQTGSHDQLTRINARLDLEAFVKQHGKEKCDAMFAHLTKRK